MDMCKTLAEVLGYDRNNERSTTCQDSRNTYANMDEVRHAEAAAGLWGSIHIYIYIHIFYVCVYMCLSFFRYGRPIIDPRIS